MSVLTLLHPSEGWACPWLWGWRALPLEVLGHLNSQPREEGHPGSRHEQPGPVGGRLCSKRVRGPGSRGRLCLGGWNPPLPHTQELHRDPLIRTRLMRGLIPGSKVGSRTSGGGHSEPTPFHQMSTTCDIGFLFEALPSLPLYWPSSFVHRFSCAWAICFILNSRTM